MQTNGDSPKEEKHHPRQSWGHKIHVGKGRAAFSAPGTGAPRPASSSAPINPRTLKSIPGKKKKKKGKAQKETLE